MSEFTEYAIRWDESISGMADISQPQRGRSKVYAALENSAYDGKVLSRTVTRSDWTPDPTPNPEPTT